MAKFVELYEDAKFISAKIGIAGKSEDARDTMLGNFVTLEIYESEHKDPGKKFVKLYMPYEEDILYITTSLGILKEGDGLLSIRTHNGANVYVFDISKAHKFDNERFKKHI